MPASDKAQLLVTFIAETVGLALAARHSTPWGLAVPWHLFLNAVLPYSSLTEPRERWRPLFYTYYASIPALMNQTDLASAETWMNTYGWNIRTPRIVFKADPNPVGVWDYDPFSVLFNGYASCTGLSVFLVSALRSMGLPARVAGTPHWNLGPSVCPQGDQSPDCGNHDWVEAWAHDGWAFVDEAGNTVLNTSWFVPDWTRHQAAGGLNHSIFAASWANSSYVVEAYGGDSDPLALPYGYFPMVWNWSIKGPNSGWDVTSRYLLFS
jgi:transglutaminase-like putative cysteine protease